MLCSQQSKPCTPGSARSKATRSWRCCSSDPPSKLAELSAGIRRVKHSGQAAAAASTAPGEGPLPLAAGEAAAAAGAGLLTVSGLAAKPA